MKSRVLVSPASHAHNGTMASDGTKAEAPPGGRGQPEACMAGLQVDFDCGPWWTLELSRARAWPWLPRVVTPHSAKIRSDKRAPLVQA